MMNIRKEHPYNFNFKAEYKLYTKVGKKRAKFSKYTQWHNYVYHKYIAYQNIPANLINFKHFLTDKVNEYNNQKHLNSTSTLALTSTITTLFITYSFALLTLFVSNNHTSSKTLGDYAVIYVLYTLFVLLGCVAQFVHPALRGVRIDKKLYFYNDYISIIDEILNKTNSNYDQSKNAIDVRFPA